MRSGSAVRLRVPEPDRLKNWLLIGSFLLYAFICFLSLASYASEELLRQYGFMPVLVTMGCCFGRGDYFRRREYGLGLLFILWTLMCGWLRGEIDRSIGAQNEFLRGLVLCGIIFPFAYLTGDRDRRLLKKLLLPVLLGMAALYCVTYIALLRGENIVLIPGWIAFGAEYTVTGRMMLKLLDLYHTCAGYLATVCFYGALYMAVCYRKTRWLPAWLLLLAVFAVGVLITYSRTAVFTLTGGVIFAVYLYLQRHPMKPVLKVLAMILTAVAVVVLTALLMDRLYEAVHSIRDIWYGLWTLSNRTDIWGAGLKVLGEKPLVLLRGLSGEQIMEEVNVFLPHLDTIQHMHSGYLQSLLRLGLPGFMAVAALTVGLIRSGRILLTSPKAELEDKFLLCLPVACLLMGAVESVIFLCTIPTELMNLLLMLFSGYTFERARQLSE